MKKLHRYIVTSLQRYSGASRAGISILDPRISILALVLGALTTSAAPDVSLLQEVATPDSGDDVLAIFKSGGGGKGRKIRIGNLVPEPSDAGLTNEVWITLRTDGKSGDGSQRNPFDGSTAAKFDARLRTWYLANTQNLVIHLGPGNFRTTGSYSYNSAKGYYLLPGWKIRGAGMDVTTLTQTGVPPEWTSRAAGHNVLESSIYNKSGDGIEISDLTIDCNWPVISGGSTNRYTNAISLNGSNNMSVRRVHVKNNYGNLASNMESFAISINPSVNSSDGSIYPITNAVIEDCVVDNYQGDNGAAFVVAVYTGSGNPAPYWSNIEVRGCSVYNFFGAGGRIDAQTIRNCKVYNCDHAIRVDTFNQDDNQTIITGNEFYKCKGNVIDLTPGLGGHSLYKWVISNNNIEITDQGGAAIAAEANGSPVVYPVDLRIEGNRIWKKSVGAGTTTYAFYFAGVHGLTMRNNIVHDGLTAWFDDRTKAGATTSKSLLFNRTNTGAAIPTLPDTDPGHAILPVCVLGSGSDQRVDNSAYTKLTIWSRTAAYASDTDNMYADGVVTVPISGIYDISANNAIDSNSANARYAIYVNGSNSGKTLANFHGSNWLGGNISMKLNANDKVAIYAWQNSGGKLNFFGVDNSASFSVRCRQSD